MSPLTQASAGRSLQRSVHVTATSARLVTSGHVRSGQVRSGQVTFSVNDVTEVPMPGTFPLTETM